LIRISLFVICTFFFLRISWRALCSPRSHGFYRFFVFEGVLSLVLLNHPYWFNDPFSPLHIFSWLLLGGSIFFIVQSVILLKRRGGYAEREEMPENHSFENTVFVVEEGLYRNIRHPMYASLFFLGWGAFCKHVTLMNIVLILLISVFLVATAKAEERENIQFFGSEYVKYMQRTKMFIPWLL